jgi:hypothetical protein
MRRRPVVGLRPDLERFEEKQLLSAGGLMPRSHANALVHRTADSQPAPNVGALTIFRITNTAYPLTVNLKPPFQQVLVQSTQPQPGDTYNILYVAMRNGTARTFDASSGLAVKVTGQPAGQSVPILTGDQQWKPGQFIVFYILTKKYYPLSPITGAGFQFNFAPGLKAIPGPSGIFLRVKYNPATFARTLDSVVAFGPGPEGGSGPRLGLPDTAIWQFVSAKTNLIPL